MAMRRSDNSLLSTRLRFCFSHTLTSAFARAYSKPARPYIQVLLCLVAFCLHAPAVWSQGTGNPTSQASIQVGAPLSAGLVDQLAIAKAYYSGIGVRQNTREAARRFRELSDLGVPEASALLGEIYLHGVGAGQDLQRAAALIRSAADSGDQVGLRLVGEMLETGRGLPQDYTQAVTFYKNAADKGDGNAFDRLGLMYLGGRGVARDPEMAFRLFSKGAELGDSWAQLNLGRMYEGGHQPTLTDSQEPNRSVKRAAIQPDYAMAVKSYQQAAEQGNRVAEFKLGQMFERAMGTAEDYGRAFDLYKKSATRSYGPALAALGRCHELGRGTEADMVSAYVAYSLALEQNNVEGAERLKSLVRKLTPGELNEAQIALRDLKAHQAANKSKAIE